MGSENLVPRSDMVVIVFLRWSQSISARTAMLIFSTIMIKDHHQYDTGREDRPAENVLITMKRKHADCNSNENQREKSSCHLTE